MNEHFELEIGKNSGRPALYLHGLGSPDPMIPQMEAALRDADYNLSYQWRNDEAILRETEPSQLFQSGTVEAIQKLAERYNDKVLVFGNSLGSYIAILAALKEKENVRGIIGTDAFLNPQYGFAEIEKLNNAGWDDAPKYECPLINNRTMEILVGVGEKLPHTSELMKVSGDSIECPVKMFVGEEDIFQPKDSLKTLNKECPQIQYETFPGINHNDWIEHFRTDERQKIIDFIQSI